MNESLNVAGAPAVGLQRFVRRLVSTESLCIIAIIMAVASMVLNVLVILRDADANNSNQTEQVTGMK